EAEAFPLTRSFVSNVPSLVLSFSIFLQPSADAESLLPRLSCGNTTNKQRSYYTNYSASARGPETSIPTRFPQGSYWKSRQGIEIRVRKWNRTGQDIAK
ncbi:uncharacterized, partial [Tachysurus ichikawai]